MSLRAFPALRRKEWLGLAAKACALTTLLLVVALDSCARLGATELTYMDGSSSDIPGFDEEAQQQLRSGEPGDHANLWEAPNYFNNRGIDDLAKSQMDARMINDAAGSSWFDMGGPDFAQPSSLYNPATDTDAVALDSSYDNAWPGTGGGYKGWEDLASDSDGYDGQWGLQAGDTEASTNAVVSGSDLAGFKAVSGAQELLMCERCYGGMDCIAGCTAQSKLASRRAAAAASAAKAKKAMPQQANSSKAAKGTSSAKTPQAVAARAATPKAAAAVVKASASNKGAASKTAARAHAQLNLCPCAGDATLRARCACALHTERAAVPSAEALLRALHGIHLPQIWRDNSKLRQYGVLVDGTPFDEKVMPEQGGSDPSLSQNWFEFFDTGRRLAGRGIKIT